MSLFHSNNNQNGFISHQGTNAPIGPDLLQQGDKELQKRKGKTSILDKSSYLSNNTSFIASSIRKLLNLGKNSQDIGSSADHFAHSTIELLGYKSLTNDRYHFLLRANAWNGDDGYADILKVGGASINDLPQKLVEIVLSRFIIFLRSFLSDMTFISIPVPSDTTAEQRLWNQQLDKINTILLQRQYTLTPRRHNQLNDRRDAILDMIHLLKKVDTQLVNRGFFLIIFAPTEKEMIKVHKTAIQFGEAALKLQDLPEKEKQTILKRLNNPNMEI